MYWVFEVDENNKEGRDQGVVFAVCLSLHG